MFPWISLSKSVITSAADKESSQSIDSARDARTVRVHYGQPSSDGTCIPDTKDVVVDLGTGRDVAHSM